MECVSYTDEQGRIWRKYSANLQKEINASRSKKDKVETMYDAYNNGEFKKVLLFEVPIAICISILNRLYQDSFRRFYKDLEPIFGEAYVFTKEDLLGIVINGKNKYHFLNAKEYPVEIKNMCLSACVLSIFSKVVRNTDRKHMQYRKLLDKYFVSEINSNYNRRKKSRELYRKQTKKEREMRAIIYYTPMGNDNKRRTRGVK